MLFTLHHPSCTGGSIVSQALAVASNSVLISEINPFENIDVRDPVVTPGFDPTSVLWHLSYNSQEISYGLKLKYFLTQIDISIQHVKSLSKNLLLRDHTATTFNFLEKDMYFIDKICNSLLLESLDYLYSVKNEYFATFPNQNPIVSIRHPLDSYISNRKRKWLYPYCGNELNIDNYCKALIRHDDYMINNKSSHIIKYEDICADLENSLSSLFGKMNLNFKVPTIEEINMVKVTGKSGRSSTDISLRKRNLDDVDQLLINQLENSKYYSQYCNFHNYNPNFKDYPLY